MAGIGMIWVVGENQRQVLSHRWAAAKLVTALCRQYSRSAIVAVSTNAAALQLQLFPWQWFLPFLDLKVWGLFLLGPFLWVYKIFNWGKEKIMTFSRPIYLLVGPWKQSQIEILSFETSNWLTTAWHITNCWKMTSVDWTACKNRKTSGKLLSRWHKRSANYLQTIRKWIIDRTDGWAGLALEQVPHCKTYECVKAMSATICKCVMITCAGHQYSRSYRLLPSTSTSNIHMASLEAVTVKSLNFYPFGILCEILRAFYPLKATLCRD